MQEKYLPRIGPEQLGSDQDNILIGCDSYPRSSFSNGFVSPFDNEFQVTLVRKGPRLDVRFAVPSAALAEQVLRELGFGADQMVASYTTVGPLRLTKREWATFAALSFCWVLAFLCWWLVFLNWNLAPTATPFVGLGVVVGVFVPAGYWLAMLLAPTHIEIGTDGLLARRRGRGHFIPHYEVLSFIQTVRRWGHQETLCLDLQLRSGENHVITVGAQSISGPLMSSIAARLDLARREYQQYAAVEADGLPRREGRSHIEWVRTLQSHRERVTHGRADVSTELLWQIVETPTSHPIARAAAAIALSHELVETERARLQHIANITASSTLRSIIEHIADKNKDLEHIAKALEALEEEAPIRSSISA